MKYRQMFRLQAVVKKSLTWIGIVDTKSLNSFTRNNGAAVFSIPSKVTSRVCALREHPSFFVRNIRRRFRICCCTIIAGASFRQLITRASIQALSVSMGTSLEASPFSRRLWDMGRQDAYFCLYHPFVVAVAAGNLHVSSFSHYIFQDVFFLDAFVKAYESAIRHADDVEIKSILGRLHRLVQEELDSVHISFAQNWGLEPLDESDKVPSPATKAYTGFLSAVATGDLKSALCSLGASVSREGSSKVGKTHPLLRDVEVASGRHSELAAYTVASMVPCMRLYAFIGQKISANVQECALQTNFYRKWIDNYGSADFEDAAQQIEQVLDRLALRLEGDGYLDMMSSLYKRAMELEEAFFEAQPLITTQEMRVPLLKAKLASETRFLFVSDFDLTCTVADSCPSLAQVSIAAAERSVSAGLRSESAVSTLRRQWNSIVDQYMLEHDELLEKLLSPHPETSSGRMHELGLTGALQQLSDFDILSNLRAEESGVLEGLLMADVREAGCNAPLLDGCGQLLDRIAGKKNGNKLKVQCHVLSACWSRAFIEGCFSKVDIEFQNIFSNELGYDQHGITTGKIVKHVETPLDKERIFKYLVCQAKQEASQIHQYPGEVCSIYVGDSVTDLPCLLEATLGIVIGESRSLKRVAQAFGVTLSPLYSGLLQQERMGNATQKCWRKTFGVVYTVSSWHELNAFLTGH